MLEVLFDRVSFCVRSYWLSYSQVNSDKASIVGKLQIVSFTINLH